MNQGRVPTRGDFLTDSLHLCVLCSFAIAQPLFDLLSRYAEFFVARHSQPLDIVLFVLVVCCFPPLLCILIEGITAILGRPVRKSLHGLIVASLAACIILPALKQIAGIPGIVLLAGAALCGVIAALGTLRFYPPRLFLTVLSPAVVIFPGLFLFFSPVSKVVFVQDAADAVDIAVETAAPVVMVVFDEFPIHALMNEHRQIDSIRYPNFAALAQDATWFRNTTTVADFTTVALPAILTGNYPDRFRLPTAVDYPRSLFTMLGKAYTIQGFESRTQLCPNRLCGNGTARESLTSRMGSLLSDLFVVYLHILLPADWSTRLPPVTRDWMHFTANAADGTTAKNDTGLLEDWLEGVVKDLPFRHPQDRYQYFRQFMATVTATQEPALYFLHLLLPHIPFIYIPSGKIYSTDSHLAGLASERWDDDENTVIRAYQRYLLQVGFVDTLLGQLVAHLKAVGLYDRSLLVVTADHGVSFRSNDARRALTETNYCDIMPVPLFIKAPFQREGAISDRNVETIDILPTVADILGVRLPWAIDGRSALDTSQPERTEKIIFQGQTSQKKRLAFGPTLEASCDTLERKVSLFGSGTRPNGLFLIGPDPTLIGQRVNDIGVAGEVAVTVELDHAGLYERIDPAAPFVPALIQGRLWRNRESADPLPLAVAVNGTIQAVTWTFEAGTGDSRFSVVVPEAAFQAGKNSVEVFVVVDSGQFPRLQRTQNTGGVTYALVTGCGQGEEMLTASDGRVIRLRPSGLQGYVDAAVVVGDFVEFQGWAADMKNSEVAEAIVIFVNGKFRYAGRANLARPDVAEAFGDAALHGAGFSYTFPLQLLDDADDPEVRIFAVSGRGVASELIYPAGYQWGKKS